MTRVILPLTALAASGFLACQGEPEVVGPGAPSASAVSKPLDRLAPGELAQGKASAFGFVAPRQMRLERRYPDAAHFVGQLRPEAVANYVRERVAVQHVEVGAARTVFPKAAIKGGAADRFYRLEVVADGPVTRLLIKDITPPPTAQGLSEAERWKRAGMTPSGELLNPKQMQ
ncbi:MAG: hypothetical protein R3B13_24590 [Polyangiaceae bacterium]